MQLWHRALKTPFLPINTRVKGIKPYQDKMVNFIYKFTNLPVNATVIQSQIFVRRGFLKIKIWQSFKCPFVKFSNQTLKPCKPYQATENSWRLNRISNWPARACNKFKQWRFHKIHIQIQIRLNKNLNFVPTQETFDKKTFDKEINYFYRRIKLKWHWSGKIRAQKDSKQTSREFPNFILNLRHT